MKTNNISMNCTHEGVNISFNYGRGPMASGDASQSFNVSQSVSVDGYNANRTDRYDLTGKRLTEAVYADKVFTEDYFAQLDAMAVKFAALISETI